MAKKIMIVDDDPIIVKYLVNLFEDNGYRTCIAADGLEAIDKVNCLEFMLILILFNRALTI